MPVIGYKENKDDDDDDADIWGVRCVASLIFILVTTWG
jgi:hypothetical protein